MPFCGPFEVPYIIDMQGNSGTILLVIKFRFHSSPSRIRVPFFLMSLLIRRPKALKPNS